MMTNRAVWAVESLQKNGGPEAYEQVTITLGTPDPDGDATAQFRYIKAMLDLLNIRYGIGMAEKVMKPCGHRCISPTVLDTAKNLWDAAVNMEDFLNKMNDMHIGGGNLRLQNGKIIGVYDTCYCSLPRLQPGMSSTYCFCSAGWFERLFSDVLKRPASVELIHSIVGGSEECVFEISF